ncbi:MAG: AsmA family protein [Gammaproteobacteria bacterium]|nr:AsmA family protein [Gammaproteobacteria bacterium]
MKLLKRLIIGLVALVVVLFVVLAIFISTLDLNTYKEQIQKITRDQTGRDLLIEGELNASFFPWVGISTGKVELANAEGFGERPFARIDAADVKVEVLPLLRRQINVKSVELSGLTLDLQRAADGHTNWDDLMQASATTATTTDNQTTEVEGGAPAIAALAVGGVSVKNANISWIDKQAGSDAQLSNFNLQTGAIALAEPFSLKTGFDVLSNSFAVNARFDAEGDVTIDLAKQKYLLTGLEMNASASGDGVPINNAALMLGGDITADLGQQQIDIAGLVLNALGIGLQGKVTVTSLDTDPQITANLSSGSPFSLLDVFSRLEIEAPVTADPDVLKEVSLAMNVKASASQAALNDLTIKLDDTTFSGQLSVPDLAGDLPPVRFAFNVDDIDLDRYLPPPAETTEAPTDSGSTPPAAEDTPIELPLELLRKLDVDGEFSLDKIKVSNLVAQSIVVQVKAKGGVITLDGILAQLYEGKIDSSVTLNAKAATPSYAVKAKLDGIQAEPLLADLLQDEAPLSGKGNFGLDITTAGNSVNGLKAGLNGGYNLSFVDGAINGINIGYQLRRARATIRGEKLSEDEAFKKTDFSALSMSGKFTKGVLSSDDLDLRAPVLRLGGKGTVDLNKDYVDYTLNTLLTDTSKGQGGKDKSDLGGVKLNVPIRGHFDELSADFTKVVLQAMQDDLKNKLKDAEAEAKAKLDAELKAKEAEVKAQLKAREDEAKAKLQAKEAEAKTQLKEKQKEEAEKLKEKAKEKLKGLFN